MVNESRPDMVTANKIINSLKSGVAPPVGFEYITVGRTFWLDEIERYYLGRFIKNGGSSVRFVNGGYGGGKTHFLNIVQSRALQMGFVVSLVVLKSRDAPFNEFETIYNRIISNISAGIHSEKKSLKNILDRWYVYKCQELKNKNIPDSANQNEIEDEVIKNLRFDLDNMEGIDYDFQNAIISFFENKKQRQSDGESSNRTIIKWLLGKKIDKKTLRNFKIHDHIDKSNSKDMMKSLVRLLIYFGYSGMLIILDEAESIPTLLRAKDRDVAYDNIRELMDNTDGRLRQGGINHCFFIYATTPDFFANEQGVKQYPALYSRVKEELQIFNRPDKRATIIDLEKDPLNPEQMLELSRKIRMVHSVAFDWKPEERINDIILDKYVTHIITRSGSDISTPRILVKTITQILELAEQYADFDPLEDVSGITTKQIVALSAQRDDEERGIDILKNIIE